MRQQSCYGGITDSQNHGAQENIRDRAAAHEITDKIKVESARNGHLIFVITGTNMFLV